MSKYQNENVKLKCRDPPVLQYYANSTVKFAKMRLNDQNEFRVHFFRSNKCKYTLHTTAGSDFSLY